MRDLALLVSCRAAKPSRHTFSCPSDSPLQLRSPPPAALPASEACCCAVFSRRASLQILHTPSSHALFVADLFEAVQQAGGRQLIGQTQSIGWSFSPNSDWTIDEVLEDAFDRDVLAGLAVLTSENLKACMSDDTPQMFPRISFPPRGSGSSSRPSFPRCCVSGACALGHSSDHQGAHGLQD